MSKVTNLQLQSGVNFADIEKLLAIMVSEHPSKIQIPNSLSYSGGFGMEGAALQLLATWFRNADSHILHTAIQKIKPDSFETLCNSLFGLCALRLADSVLLASKEEIDLAVALRPAIPVFARLRSEDFKNSFKGPYLTLPAIKAPVIRGARDREFDSPLYNNHDVIGAQKFAKVTRKAFGAILPRLDEVNPSTLTHLSEILRELFTNTHRHGRTDVDGNPLAKNFRGIIFNSISLSAARLDEISKSDGRDMSLFILDWRPSGNRKFRALDITVVDAGPGFARRWHGLDKDQLTIEQEKTAIIECFSKHKSTDTTDSSGSGLSNVLEDLRILRGWFRLRTGRTRVEKSFFKQGGSNTVGADDIKEMGGFAEGVVFNVVIPLDSLLGAR